MGPTRDKQGDSITLVVTGNTGTWTEVEADGDQEVKKVTFEPENQKVIIGDDVKIYVAEENQIIIDDMDREASDRIVLKKQTSFVGIWIQIKRFFNKIAHLKSVRLSFPYEILLKYFLSPYLLKKSQIFENIGNILYN